MKLLSFLSDVD